MIDRNKNNQLDAFKSNDKEVNELNDSILLNKRLKIPTKGKYANLHNVCKELIDELSIPSRTFQRRLKLRALENIVMNIVKAEEENKYLAVSKNRNDYGKLSNRYGYKYFTLGKYTAIFNALRNRGFIAEYPGFYDVASGKGKRTRLRATDIFRRRLFGCMESYTYSIHKVEFYSCRGNNVYVIDHDYLTALEYPAQPIIMKDRIKIAVNYTDTKVVRKMRRRLQEYNDLMADTSVLEPRYNSEALILNSRSSSTLKYIHLPYELNEADQIMTMQYGIVSPSEADYSTSYSVCDWTSDMSSSGDWRYTRGPTPDITKTDLHNLFKCKELQTQLYRVFNNDNFKHGGRFYGAEYQQLNSNKRSELIINGQSVIEIDYSSFHMNMLYNLNGKNLNSDPYDLFNEDDSLRAAVKLLVNIAINSSSPRATISAFNQKLNICHKNPDKRIIINNIRFQMSRLGITAGKLLEIILEKHPIIEDHLCSGVGLTLQNRDSMIAADILHYFTKEDIPCLCIHDSFIVSKEHGDLLSDVMRETYQIHMNGFSCKTKISSSFYQIVNELED